jgi:catechol 2,3-dioxygenase-like lactoylglutathione lyase family enzyme
MKVAQFQDVIPVLPVRDVSEAARYYTEKLGFRLLFQDVPDAPRYAGIGRDGVRLHLQWHDPTDFREAVDTPMLRFLIDDVDALFDEYADKGVFHERTALRDTPWGTREFAFYDLDGNGLTFYRPLDAHARAGETS